MKDKIIIVAIGMAALALAGCGKKDENKAKKGPATPAAGDQRPVAPPAPKAMQAVPRDKPTGPVLVTGFKTPESVLYDTSTDVYLVSNINGDPFGVDDNGFISRVTPDGKSEVWIDGAKKEVTLNAPKGMALLGEILYVADITTVRMFDRTTGAAKGEVAIKGASFLNDLATGAEAVYVSDSGMDAGFKPNGGDAIYKIAGGKATPVIKGKELGNPNGLTVAGADLWVVTFGSGELYKVTAAGKREAAVKPPKGKLDGLLLLEGGDLLLSSWEANAVFRGPPAGPFTEAAKDLVSPADFGWDGKRKRLLVPLFTKDTVAFVDLPR